MEIDWTKHFIYLSNEVGWTMVLIIPLALTIIAGICKTISDRTFNLRLDLTLDLTHATLLVLATLSFLITALLSPIFWFGLFIIPIGTFIGAVWNLREVIKRFESVKNSCDL